MVEAPAGGPGPPTWTLWAGDYIDLNAWCTHRHPDDPDLLVHDVRIDSRTVWRDDGLEIAFGDLEDLILGSRDASTKCTLSVRWAATRTAIRGTTNLTALQLLADGLTRLELVDYTGGRRQNPVGAATGDEPTGGGS